MKVEERIDKRFEELTRRMEQVDVVRNASGVSRVNSEAWEGWSTSVLNLLEISFGPNSIHYQNFKNIYDNFRRSEEQLGSARGVFRAAKEDYEGGYVLSLQNTISGEVFGDFIDLAKQSLSEGHKDVAAVLACAALEDALKRYARSNGLDDVEDKAMQEVVNALKSKGLIKGAQKTLLDTMPKMRDYAMHANWDKLTAESVNSVIGFVEQFLLSHFSD